MGGLGQKCAHGAKTMEKLLSRDSKIGGVFITMPVKGVGDALHECYKGFVTE
jgi:hypothetical protein